MTTAALDTLELSDLKEGIVIPEVLFDAWLERFNWSWHQVTRGEFPAPFTSLEQFQYACICVDPVLWTWAHLKEPDNPGNPYTFFDYQEESVRYHGHTLHETASEVGKSREIMAYCLWKAFTVHRGSGLVAAPQTIYLVEIIDMIEEQFSFNPMLHKSLLMHRKQPHHHMRFTSGFKLDFRPTDIDGKPLRGVHARTFCLMDESVKAKNKQIFDEFWRAGKPECVFKLYSVPDGDRSCEFYRLCQKAEGRLNEDDDEFTSRKYFKKFHWSKRLMPAPFWTKERERLYVDQYGGQDSPGFKHNVEGEWGDAENTVFPWAQFQHLVKEVPEYRCLKILVDKDTVYLTGYGVAEKTVKYLVDTNVSKSQFNIATEIKSFFSNQLGLKFGGCDLGYSQDPTEIVIRLILGKTWRTIARLQMKGVTYDMQANAIEAMDEVFDSGKLDMGWGVDFGNAGSAVVHMLHNLAIYEKKRYEYRLIGFQFGAMYDAVNEEGDLVFDTHTEKPLRLSAKELATDIVVSKMQRLELEFPHDPDIVLYYPNHTSRVGSNNRRIFKKEDDHIIDAGRCATLRVVLDQGEDIFA